MRYIAHRVLLYIPMLLLLTLMVFLLMRVIPGDPALLILAGTSGDGSFTKAGSRQSATRAGHRSPRVCAVCLLDRRSAARRPGDVVILPYPHCARTRPASACHVRARHHGRMPEYSPRRPPRHVVGSQSRTACSTTWRGSLPLRASVFPSLSLAWCWCTSWCGSSLVSAAGLCHAVGRPVDEFTTDVLPDRRPGVFRAQLRGPCHPFGHAGSVARGLCTHGPRQGVPEYRVVLLHALRNASLPIVTVASVVFRSSAGRDDYYRTHFSRTRHGKLSSSMLLRRGTIP